MSKNLALETHAPAYLSVHDIHAYYGESYIVQGEALMCMKGKYLRFLVEMGQEKPQP